MKTLFTIFVIVIANLTNMSALFAQGVERAESNSEHAKGMFPPPRIKTATFPSRAADSASGDDFLASSPEQRLAELERWATDVEDWRGGVDRWQGEVERWVSGVDRWRRDVDAWALGINKAIEDLQQNR